MNMRRAEIRIAGRLDTDWADWFEGFTIRYTPEGQTLLTGCVPDQAALYGLFAKLRDLGVQLISVNFDLPAGAGTVSGVDLPRDLNK